MSCSSARLCLGAVLPVSTPGSAWGFSGWRAGWRFGHGQRLVLAEETGGHVIADGADPQVVRAGSGGGRECNVRPQRASATAVEVAASVVRAVST